MITSRRFAVVAATCVLVAACGWQRQAIASADRETIHAWLVCEECIDGEREAVEALGQPVVAYLASVIDSVPAAIVDPTRVRLFNRWNPSLGSDRDTYVSSGVENLESLARIRAARSLGDLLADDELRDALALARSRDYRDDVQREIEGALLVATRPVTEVGRVRVEPKTITIAVGATGEPAAFVEDSLGNVLTGTPTWSSSNATVATVDAAGVVTGTGPGTAVIRATRDGNSDSTVVTVTAAPAPVNRLIITSGDHQTANSGAPLRNPVEVTLVTPSGDPVSGEEVMWTVLLGGGTVQPDNTTTRANGTARVSWLLGGAGPQRLEARSANSPAVVFRATAND